MATETKAKRKAAPAKAKPPRRSGIASPRFLVIEKYPDGGTYAYRTSSPPKATAEADMLDIECDLSSHDAFVLVFALK